jgi:predicted flap endonuclease-1-like 5' DNA nuclease
LNEWEHTWAYVAGGGLTLIMLAFGLAAIRSGSNESLVLMLVVGILLLIAGTVCWLVQLQPWKNFDDLTTPYYTGHAHHGDHAAHDDHADHEVHSAIAELIDSGVTVGEPYAADFGEGHIEPADLPPPPEIMDPISAFPPPTEAAPEPPPTIREPLAAATTSTPDDLSRLKGIGPKISTALKAAGITTFAQLAERSATEVEQIVRNADVKSVIHPENWIADAKKVVAGDTSVLEH